MHAFRFRIFAAGLAMVGLMEIADEIATATAIAAEKTTTKTNLSASGSNRQTKPAKSTPSEKLKPSGKSKPSGKVGTPGKSKRSTKSRALTSKGVFVADITTGGRTRTLKSSSKAISTLRRAVAAKRRADKIGQADDTFKAVINLNDVRFEFTDPAAAAEACRELAKILFRARKERIFLGDIGRIEAADMVADEESSATDSNTSPKKGRRTSRKQKQQAAAQANARVLAIRRAVQYRINVKIQTAIRKNGGRKISPNHIQQIVQAEIKRAQKDGLIPADMQNSGSNAAGRGGREAHIEAYRRELGRAFSQGKRLDTEN